jgi:predicted metal-dependent phosphoesterase TrpH
VIKTYYLILYKQFLSRNKDIFYLKYICFLLPFPDLISSPETQLSKRGIPGVGDPVHILAYYGMCGPSRFDELDSMLLNIRDGRYLRAKNMLSKLNTMKVPIKWEHVTKIAGEGVAPGRLHIARALVEAGYVDNVREAFNKYLGNDGHAYAT